MQLMFRIRVHMLALSHAQDYTSLQKRFATAYAQGCSSPCAHIPCYPADTVHCRYGPLCMSRCMQGPCAACPKTYTTPCIPPNVHANMCTQPMYSMCPESPTVDQSLLPLDYGAVKIIIHIWQSFIPSCIAQVSAGMQNILL